MTEIIAFCGLACHECGAFMATKNDDDEKRKKVSQQWSKHFNSDIKPEDINCDGCTTRSSRVFAHCLECKVRLCGIAKGVKNCAYCSDYACDNLQEYFKLAPKMKESLESIRKTFK